MIPVGRRIDRYPWDWVQGIAALALLSAMAFLVWLIEIHLADYTLGTVRVAEYGAAIGTFVIAPVPIWAMTKTTPYLRMNGPNKFACWFGVLVAASIYSYGALLLINASDRATPAFEGRFNVVAMGRPKNGSAPLGWLHVRGSDYGIAEIRVRMDVWERLSVGSQIVLVLRPGRLGFPVILDYR